MKHAFSTPETFKLNCCGHLVSLTPEGMAGLRRIISAAMNWSGCEAGGILVKSGSGYIPAILAGSDAAARFSEVRFDCWDVKDDRAVVFSQAEHVKDGSSSVGDHADERVGDLAAIRFCTQSRDGKKPFDWIFALASNKPLSESSSASQALVQLSSAAGAVLQACLDSEAVKASCEQSFSSAEHLEYVTELAGVGGWEIDSRSGLVSWTEQTCRIHDAPAGYAPSLEDWFDFCLPSHRQSLELAYREAVDNGTGWKLDLPVRTSTGRNIWVSSVCQPVFEADGTVKLIGSLMDVSARHSAEEEIERSQRLYRSTLNALSEAILVADKDGFIRWHNGAAEDILDCSTIYEGMTHLADVPCLVEPSSAAQLDLDENSENSLLTVLLDAKETRKLTLQVIVGANQTRRWVKCRSEPLMSSSDNAFVGLVISIEDITEHKRNEEILNEAFEAIPNGFAVYDQDDKMVMANGAYRETFMQGIDLKQHHETYRELLKRNLTTGRYAEVTTDPDGQDAWIATRMMDAIRGSTGYIDLLNDQRWIQTNSRFTPSAYRAEYFADVTEIKKSGALLEAVYDNIPSGLAMFDSEQILSKYNIAFADVLGVDAEILKTSPTLREMLTFSVARQGLEGAELRIGVERSLQRLSGTDIVVYERVFPEGQIYEVKYVPLPDRGLILIVDDITIQKNYQKQLEENVRLEKEKSAELEQTFANMKQGMSVFDKDGCLQHWNQKYLDVFGKSPTDVYQGIPFRDILLKEKMRGEMDGDVDLHIAKLRDRLAQGEVVSNYFRLKSGRLVCCVHVPTPSGGWIGTQEEIDNEDPEFRSFQKKTQIDPVTADANESWLLEDIRETVSALCLNGGSAALMVLSVGYAGEDCNGQKNQMVDDRAALIVSRRIRECIRPGDLLARLGDGRFAVLYPKISAEKSTLNSIAQRVLDLLDAPLVLDGEKHTSSIHLGLVPLSADTSGVDEVLEQAGLLSLEASKIGRSAFLVADH